MHILRAGWAIIWRIALFLVLWGALLALVIVPFMAYFADLPKQHPVPFQLYFDAGGALTILLASWFMVRFVDRRSFSALGLAADRPACRLLIGLGVGTGWLTSSMMILALFGGVRYDPQGTLYWSSLACSATAMLLNTLTQQSLGFGYIFHTIQARSNTFAAVVLAALLFAVLHLGAIQGDVWAAANVFGAGVLFGVARWATGSLWTSIGIHYAWNVLLGPVLGVVVSGQHHLTLGWRFFQIDESNAFAGGHFGPEASPIVTGTTWLLIGVLLVYRAYNRSWPNESPAVDPARMPALCDQ